MSQTFLVTATVIFCQIVHLVQGPASPVSSPQSHKNDKAQYSSSGLADFFQEPKLGTAWYNPNGPTPTFDMKQENGWMDVLLDLNQENGWMDGWMDGWMSFLIKNDNCTQNRADPP